MRFRARAPSLAVLVLLLFGVTLPLCCGASEPAGDEPATPPEAAAPEAWMTESGVDLDASNARPSDPEVTLGGMTYVSSRGPRNDMIVEAETARIKPDEEIAYLEDVRIRLVGAGADKGGLDMTCERGTFRFQTGDFLAEGNVRGRTGDGRDFRTERVRYLHEEHMAKTDDPVLIQDETGTYRGGGFEYFINQNRFRLLGGASVVQTQ